MLTYTEVAWTDGSYLQQAYLRPSRQTRSEHIRVHYRAHIHTLGAVNALQTLAKTKGLKNISTRIWI